MPPLRRLRSSALAELAEQLRFAPSAATLKQIERAEALAGELDPDTTYPEDWIVYRVTGYRPEIDEPSLLVGEALLADLSAFVERLCDSHRVPASSCADGLTIDELTSRWGVSRRTVERFRRHGLIARRVRTAGGRVRLSFSPSVVEEFERREAGRVGRATGFTRLTDDERVRTTELAERLGRDAPGLSEAATVARIATELGRSPGAVRALIGSRDSRGALSPRDRRLIHRALEFGVPASRLAERFGRSRASISRVALQRRAELLRRVELPEHAGRPRPVPPAAGAPGAPVDLRVSVERDPEAFVREALDAPPPDAGVERRLAEIGVRLAIEAADRLAALDPASPRADELDEIETRLRWWLAIIDRLAHEMRGVVARAAVARAAGATPDAPALEVARAGAMAAVARFDPAGGGRLAAAVTLAVDRALAAHPHDDERVAGGPVARPKSPPGLAGWSRLWPVWRPVVQAPGWADQITARGGAGSAAVRLRFGLDGDRPRTRRDAAGALGVTAAGVDAACRRARRRWLAELARRHAGER